MVGQKADTSYRSKYYNRMYVFRATHAAFLNGMNILLNQGLEPM